MDNEWSQLHKEFLRIKEQNWVKTIKNGNNGIELKAKRYKSHSYTILFSCTPTGPHYHEVERIKDLYGYPHRELKEYNILNNSVFCNAKTKIGVDYFFEMEVNKKEEKLYLRVYNSKEQLIEKIVYWDFDILQEKLYRKLKKLALIKAYSKKIDGIEYFKYYKIDMYRLIDFNSFIDLIERGKIRINFKLNIRTKGDKIGQIHDHGTSFDILEQDLEKLYTRFQ